MITSLVKIVLFVVLIAAITFAAGQIMDTGGSLNLQFGGQEISISPIQGMIGIVLFIGALWCIELMLELLIAVFKFFNGDENALSRYFVRNREKRGFDALADGLVAIAAGEGKLAVTKATMAERYLKKPALTNLINAQAAELNGDIERALKYYKKLLGDDRTRFVGVHGIMKQKLAEGDTDTALKLAKKAITLRPSHKPSLSTLFDLQIEKKEWAGAQKTIAATVKANGLPKDVARRREAVVVFSNARQLLDAGDIELGKEAALSANKLSPGLVPAVVLAAEMHMLANDKRAAAKVLKRAWAVNPHPDLAASFAEIVPKETSIERLKRFKALISQNPDHEETKLLKAELALADEDFPSARRAVRDLVQTKPTTRSLTIMAAIEKGEGALDHVVRGWLNKALSASVGAQWVCSNCHTVESSWAPRCENCNGFDVLDWTIPARNISLNGSSAILGFTSGMLTEKIEKSQNSVVEAEVLS